MGKQFSNRLDLVGELFISSFRPQEFLKFTLLIHLLVLNSANNFVVLAIGYGSYCVIHSQLFTETLMYHTCNLLAH